MDTPKPRKANVEALGRHLQASLKQQRPRRWKMALGLILAVAVFVGALLWVMRPAPPIPLMAVMAWDDLYGPGEPITYRAQLEAVEPNEQVPAGMSIFFQSMAGPGEGTLLTGSADSRGLARVEGKAGPFLTIFVTPDKKRRTEDRAEIFLWPRETKIIAIDIESGLAEGWGEREISQLTPEKGAGEALEELLKKGYRPVYLAFQPQKLGEYRNLREWVHQQGFPAGPVLHRRHAEEGHAAILQDLARRFGSPVYLVTRDLARQKSATEWKGIVPLSWQNWPDVIQGVDRNETRP